jgi:hypothetical protein
MMTKISSLFLVAFLAVACGDNLKPSTPADSSMTGDTGGGFPAAPTLGVQVDRMARPAINTALNHGFDPTAAAGTAKDAYNQDGRRRTCRNSPATSRCSMHSTPASSA